VPCLNPSCNGYVEYLDPSCDSCKLEFTEDDWDYFLSTCDLNMQNNLLDSASSYDPEPICCANSFMECECSKTITWEDSSDVPTHIWENFYEYEETPFSCSSCKYYYTSQCIPLRDAVKTFVNDGVVSEQLNRCSFYVEYNSSSVDTSIFIDKDF
jgi:hypothetical protein